LLYGIKPVVIAVVAQAIWGLGRSAFKRPLALVIAAGIVALYLLGFNEIVLLFGGGLAYFAVRRAELRLSNAGALGVVTPVILVRAAFETASTATDYSGLRLFVAFLKIGAVLYGSGYVLLAFLRSEFVIRLGWLTERQLLDAVAVGQVTPGPVFTTATFVGYVVGGLPGALLATLAIFLPAFCFVGFTHPLVSHIRRRPLLGELLDGVNVAAIGLMLAVMITLTRDAIVDLPTALVTVVAAILLIRWKVNATWLIALGGAVGLLRWLIG
jgi:chromate transporter